MKVLLLNGSPHETGCTYTALEEISRTLREENIETETVWIGKEPIGGCIACGVCAKTGKCVRDGGVNAFVEKARTADGFVFGSPVHYAAASGDITAFLDRAFFSGKSAFTQKPASVIVSARRAGTTAALDQLTKYLTISQMPVISSTYWNMVHGSKPEDVQQDAEGLQTMRNLARNMAWILRCIDAGRAAGIEAPATESNHRTNFIR